MVKLMESNRWKAEEVKNGQPAKILTTAEWVVDNYKQPDGSMKPTNSLVASVEISGVKKDLRFTKATRENCKDAWGMDTAGWVGKQAMITIVPTEKGKSIMLSPVVSVEEAWK